MPFDADHARRLVRQRDRDTARFFAGRSAEIQRFDDDDQPPSFQGRLVPLGRGDSPRPRKKEDNKP